jgi:hypothetical protein
MRLYFDICCPNRPLNDRTQEQIRFEVEAVWTLLTRVEQGDTTKVHSPMHTVDIRKISNSQPTP